MKKKDYVWYDRKRHLGLPISFTKYYINDDRLFLEAGFFTTNIDEILLYRIKDISVRITLWQKLFRVGTITVVASDKTHSNMELINIKKPRKIKEILHKSIEDVRDRKKMRFGEILESDMRGSEEVFDDPMDN